MGKKLLRWNLEKFVRTVEQRIKNQFDCIIVIDGKRGLGKSTLAYKIACRLKNIKCPFVPRKDIVYSKDEVISHLSNKKDGIIFADEMINVTFNRDFYDQKQKDLIKGLNMYRDSFNVFLACVPNFFNLDTQFQGLASIRLNVVKRGVAVIHTQRQSSFSRDPWDLKNNQKIETQWSAKGITVPRYTRLTTCNGILKFNDITANQRKLYESIKHHKRNKIFEEQTNQDKQSSPEFKMYQSLIKEVKKGIITEEHLRLFSSMYNVKYTTLRNKLNIYLKDEGNPHTLKDFLLPIKSSNDKKFVKVPVIRQNQ
jgi:hypothetical protein